MNMKHRNTVIYLPAALTVYSASVIHNTCRMFSTMIYTQVLMHFLAVNNVQQLYLMVNNF